MPGFQYFGIPQHYGMFYAMGAALIMEGVLSGCYHVCPNHSNFQFGKWNLENILQFIITFVAA
jgi:type III secretory pathway component EscT